MRSLIFRRLPAQDQVRRSCGRRIGILGGSFNPAHEGHLHISVQALKKLALDEVWWLLSPQNPLKSPEILASTQRRLASCLSVACHPQIRVTCLEFCFKSIYTADAVADLKAYMPDKRFVWLMGEDNFRQFHLWYHWERIVKQVPLVVVSRLPGGMPGSFSSISGPFPGVGVRNARRKKNGSHVLSSPAAKKLALYRYEGRWIADQHPPAWSFVIGPSLSLSSTELRQAGLF